MNGTRDYHQDAFVSFRPNSTDDGMVKGKVLLAYIIEPFLLKKGEKIPNSHTHYHESVLMAQVFLEMGYAVDAISYHNTTFQPKKDYDLFISARTNFEKISKRLNDNCIKIAHLDMAHWLFNNKSAYDRCIAIQNRKGVTLPLKTKLQEFNWAIELADYATILGNRFTLETYKYANKQIFRLSIPTCATYSWFSGKDFKKAKKNFLWFGSSGFVHKGLDVTLDAFAGMPEHHLYVCGPIEKEKEFVQAYYKELYETPNIHTVGWVDVEDSTFEELRNTCVGLIYPSASEGQAGSVVTCMQAGLIPIVSYESGVDIDTNFGLLLPDSTIEEIRKGIIHLSNMPEDQLIAMAKKAWEEARSRYTKEVYAREFKAIIQEILELEKGKK